MHRLIGAGEGSALPPSRASQAKSPNAEPRQNQGNGHSLTETSTMCFGGSKIRGRHLVAPNLTSRVTKFFTLSGEAASTSKERM